MLYMLTFTINIPPMLAYIPYMDPMGFDYLPEGKQFFPTQPDFSGPIPPEKAKVGRSKVPCLLCGFPGKMSWE